MKVWRIDKINCEIMEIELSKEIDIKILESNYYGYRATEVEALEVVYTLTGVRLLEIVDEINSLQRKREVYERQMQDFKPLRGK